MKKLSIPMTKGEIIWGFGYLIFQMLFLPSVMLFALDLLGLKMNLAQINFIFYCVNLLAIVLIFRKFLLQNIDRVAADPMRTLMTVLFGMGRYLLLSALLGSLLYRLDPDFVNANDDTVAMMVGENLPLMALGTIVLVPPAEECLFRGLIFRNLHDKNRTVAYLVSIVAFAAIHLVGYLAEYTPMELLIAFLQYVPAGFCLAWAYERADSIFAPILIHSLVNTMGIAAMR